MAPANLGSAFPRIHDIVCLDCLCRDGELYPVYGPFCVLERSCILALTWSSQGFPTVGIKIRQTMNLTLVHNCIDSFREEELDGSRLLRVLSFPSLGFCSGV